MRRANRITLVGVFALILTAAQASAAPITYTWWGQGSGFLGNNSFADALVTFNYYADTDTTVFGSSGTAHNEAGTGTVTIDGLGTAPFTDSRMAAVWTSDTGYVLLGYRGLPSAAPAYAIAVTGYVLPGWDFVSPVGPATGRIYFSPEDRFATTLGEFYWSSAMSSSPTDPSTYFTFQATTGGPTVPEPASILLLGAGLGALALRKRRR